MNGNYIFNEVLGSEGAVINSGTINAAAGGRVLLTGSVSQDVFSQAVDTDNLYQVENKWFNSIIL